MIIVIKVLQRMFLFNWRSFNKHHKSFLTLNHRITDIMLVPCNSNFLSMKSNYHGKEFLFIFLCV